MDNLTLKGIFEELCKGNISILTLEVQQFISQKIILYLLIRKMN